MTRASSPHGRLLSRGIRSLIVALAPALLALPASASAQATPPVVAQSSASAALEQFAALGLTPAQGRTIDSLSAAARTERDALLARHGVQAGQGAGSAASFTEEERKTLQRIGADYERALQALLTPGQQQKLAQARSALRQRHAAAADAAAKAAHAKRPTEPPAGVRAPSGSQGAPPSPPSGGNPDAEQS